jgi:hypothetical protein
MSIRFSCSCGRKLKVSDEKIGMKVLCSSCGATLKVPKKSQDEYWQDVPVKSDEAKVDYAGALRAFLVHFVPGGVVILVLCWGAYFLSTQIIVGKGNLPPLGSVSGKVTINGKPLPNASIRFIPLDDEGRNERKGASVAMGLTDDAGHYRLLYVKDTYGAAVGKNRVQIQAKDEAGRERVQHDFNSLSQLQREVKSGSQEFDFDVKGTDAPSSSTDTANPTPSP